jgi:hypothetical protein
MPRLKGYYCGSEKFATIVNESASLFVSTCNENDFGGVFEAIFRGAGERLGMWKNVDLCVSFGHILGGCAFRGKHLILEVAGSFNRRVR